MIGTDDNTASEGHSFDPLDFWLNERMYPEPWDALAPEQREALACFARQHLGIPVLELRCRDALDFHEVSVLAMRDALARAFCAGARQPPR